MNKKFKLALLISLGCSGTFAQSHLIVATADSDKSFDLESVDRITFTESQMNVTLMGGETENFDFSEILKMYFGDNGGVEMATADDSMQLIAAERGSRLSLKGVEQPQDTYVFNSSGTLLLLQKQWDGSMLDVSSFPAGTYLLVSGNKAFKFIKQ